VHAAPGPRLPYSVVAGVAPTGSGWLVASAKLRGATFAPDEPRLFDSFREVLDVRPPFQIIVVNVPIGYFDESSAVQRSCDREAQALLEGPSPAQASAPMPAHLFAEIDGDGGRHFAEGDFRLERVREVAREMYPSSQRVVHEGHPDLSFYQLNGYEALRWSSHSDDGRDERRAILERKVAGVARVLDAELAGVVPRELNDVAALLWTARRVFGHSAARLPSEGEWDSKGLRMELVM
jgi:predicted RNase H-like nuclease